MNFVLARTNIIFSSKLLLTPERQDLSWPSLYGIYLKRAVGQYRSQPMKSED
jgi:hypothetical protein